MNSFRTLMPLSVGITLALFSLTSTPTLAASTFTEPTDFKAGIDRAEFFATGDGLATSPNIYITIKDIIFFLLSLVAILAVLAIIWGALMYILSLGNESRTALAKQIVLYAIIGVLITGLSFAVVALINAQL